MDEVGEVNEGIDNTSELYGIKTTVLTNLVLFFKHDTNPSIYKRAKTDTNAKPFFQSN